MTITPVASPVGPAAAIAIAAPSSIERAATSVAIHSSGEVAARVPPVGRMPPAIGQPRVMHKPPESISGGDGLGAVKRYVRSVFEHVVSDVGSSESSEAGCARGCAAALPALLKFFASDLPH